MFTLYTKFTLLLRKCVHNLLKKSLIMDVYIWHDNCKFNGINIIEGDYDVTL